MSILNRQKHTNQMLFFISKERLDIIKETRLEGAPDLVIEILFPATTYYDLRKKFKIRKISCERILDYRS